MMKKRRSQVTLFLILGIIIIMVVVGVIMLSRYAAKKISTEETIGAKEVSFDVQPIRNFVTECLLATSKDGLRLIGEQGGYIFRSQGGTIVDYNDRDEGTYFIDQRGTKIVYNIHKPRFNIGNFRSTLPDYPWKTFPYTDETKSAMFFGANSVFGTNTMPPLNKSFGRHSLQEQLTTYVTSNIDKCMDISIFEEQGFRLTKNDKQIGVSLNENDVTLKMSYEIEIENLVSREKTTISEFIVKHDVRLAKIHSFVRWLVDNDISNIKFNIVNRSGNFDVSIRRDAFDQDDLITVTDWQSFLGNNNYKYTFARKNRNPAMFYLTPEEIILPRFTEIHNDTLITNYPDSLKAIDPDEDLIETSNFSINPETPISLIFPFIEFTISVNDGELEDYQIIKVISE